jgi:hypothetical protein
MSELCTPDAVAGTDNDVEDVRTGGDGVTCITYTVSSDRNGKCAKGK